LFWENAINEKLIAITMKMNPLCITNILKVKFFFKILFQGNQREKVIMFFLKIADCAGICNDF
jgi:hypothetical protein